MKGKQRKKLFRDFISVDSSERNPDKKPFVIVDEIDPQYVRRCEELLANLGCPDNDSKSPVLDPKMVGGNWDDYYAKYGEDGFPTKNYVYDEYAVFNQIDRECRLLEIGCGTGTLLYPLLSRNPHIVFTGIDISAEAIEVARSSREYNPERIEDLLVVNIADPADVENSGLRFGYYDMATLFFTLSAINPADHEAVLANVFKLLKPGGVLVVRDYAKYDLSMLRFDQCSSKIADSFYIRSGTGLYSYFFTRERFESLCKDFEVVESHYIIKDMVNRRRKTFMKRIWYGAIVRKPIEVCPGENGVP